MLIFHLLFCYFSHISAFAELLKWSVRCLKGIIWGQNPERSVNVCLIHDALQFLFFDPHHRDSCWDSEETNLLHPSVVLPLQQISIQQWRHGSSVLPSQDFLSYKIEIIFLLMCTKHLCASVKSNHIVYFKIIQIKLICQIILDFLSKPWKLKLTF